MSETREQRLAGIRERAKKFAKEHGWWDDSDPVVDDLAAFADSEIDKLQSKVVCSFCGTVTEFDRTKEDAQMDAIFAHIETCEKSQVRQLLDALQENARLKAALDSERERVLLEAAKAVCETCANDDKAIKRGNDWTHLGVMPGEYVFCSAQEIHELRSKGQQERKNDHE